MQKKIDKLLYDYTDGCGQIIDTDDFTEAMQSMVDTEVMSFAEWVIEYIEYVWTWEPSALINRYKKYKHAKED